METNTKSMASVVWQKVIDETDELTLGELITFLAKLGGALFFAGMMTDTTLPARVLMWHHYLVPNTLFVLAIAFLGPKLWAFVRKEWQAAAPLAHDSIEGIPTVELLDHLFTAKSLKLKEATEKFHTKQTRMEAIVKRLREIDVLVPGPNNASVLNPEMSRQDVASIFKGKSAAKDLEPLFRKDALGLTTRPSMPEIEERLNTPPLRAPGFVTRTSAYAG
jgi:hypothetical protein